MPSRIFPFVNGQYYHVYNRGTEKRLIFKTQRDHHRFFETMHYYQFEGPKPRFSKSFNSPLKPDTNKNKKIVDIICYCLMPNHFHFLLRQLEEGGITEFVSKLANSYTKYFNTKHRRVGPLFQGEFKAILVESDEHFIHLSRYIHLNPLVSHLIKDLSFYKWSSYNEFIEGSKGICNKEEILAHFKTAEKYKKFIMDRADYAEKLELIKHQLLEEDEI